MQLLALPPASLYTCVYDRRSIRRKVSYRMWGPRLGQKVIIVLTGERVYACGGLACDTIFYAKVS